MSLREIVAETFRFHRCLYVSLTERCPIKCRHCFTNSGPTETVHASQQAFQDWMRGIVASKAIKIIFFSGGEPFSNPKVLAAALSQCNSNGIYSIVCSSAYWARSENDADRFLGRYPPIDCLWLSTDLFHAEFVGLERLRHAAAAARRRSIEVVFQVAELNPDIAEFAHRLRAELGDELWDQDRVYITPLSKVGRAVSDAPEIPVPTVEFERLLPTEGLDSIDAPCPLLGTPWLREDGRIAACPNHRVFRAETHALHLGDLQTEPFALIRQRAEADPYVQGLRVFGPGGLIRELPLTEWGWSVSRVGGDSICDLCHSIADVPGLAARIRERLAKPDFDARIRALRLAFYSELTAAPSKEPSPEFSES